MPDLFLYASKPDASVLSKLVNIIGPALRSATARAIPDLEGDPNKVAVYIIAHHGGDNIPALQIVGMASWSEDREKYLNPWKEELAGAWQTLLKTRGVQPFASRFSLDKVEIWPTMPKGSWGIAENIVRKVT